MPELPEVETTCRGLAPHLTGKSISQVVIRNGSLRWPIPAAITKLLPGQCIHNISRRGKYLLLECANGWLILHLGMSGSLRVLPSNTPPEKHDHFDLVLDNRTLMRLHDPRRFGAVLWTESDVFSHPLLSTLGVEPLTDDFTATMLYNQTRTRSACIKQVLMDSHLVVGVGNIYANESLFRAGISPKTAANRISRARYANLVAEIKETLKLAISAGGSSLRDFVGAEGKPGYFQQQYFVYGRTGEACRNCNTNILQIRQGQRSTFYCTKCQSR